MKKLICLLILLPSIAKADFLENSVYTLIAIDWIQTVGITKDDNFIEDNNILGEYPTEREVHRYMASRILFTYLINKTEFGEMWNWYVVIETGADVINNYHIGVDIKF